MVSKNMFMNEQADLFLRDPLYIYISQAILRVTEMAEDEGNATQENPHKNSWRLAKECRELKSLNIYETIKIRK